MKERNVNVDHCVEKNLNELRDEERSKRIKIYGEVEEKRQQVTSALMLDLLKLCQEKDVPSYILAIAKVLDNYQGKISNWCI